MAKYRKKPVVIEAMELTQKSYPDVMAFLGVARSSWIGDAPPVLFIETREGTMRADAGDFVIRGVKGEFYPCKPDIFAATYEAVE